MTDSRWAVLKCKFTDDDSDTVPDDFYVRLFTGAGTGTSNMVDFFRDMTHGELDLSRSQVFGWFTIPYRKAAYAGNVPNSALMPGLLNRWGLFNACRAAAEAGGVDLTGFAGIVVTMNRGMTQPSGSTGIDLWGAAGGFVFCDREALTPSLLGHEMGHGYGLNHSRRDGSEMDYQDPWDIMSAAATFMQPHPAYRLIGPGLNAANMRSRGWLDETRVWRSRADDTDVVIALRPLHRRELPGLLAADIPDPGFRSRRCLAEFRNARDWDGGFREPCVLLHRLDANYSYLMPGPFAGRDYLRAGDIIERGDPSGPYFRLEVISIDPSAETCLLRVRHRSARPFEWLVGLDAGKVIGPVPVDGGGLIIRPDGVVVPIGPYDPTLKIVEAVSTYQGVQNLQDTSAREAAQRAALASIVSIAQAQFERLDPIKGPPAKQELLQIPPPK